MVTMTTVGFGDYYPVTYFGRLVIIISCFTGIFIVSMTMVTLNNSKNFSLIEGKSFTLLRRLTHRKKVIKLAGSSVLLFMRSVISKKKYQRDQNNPIHKTDLMQAEETMDRLVEMFKSERLKLTPEEVP